LAHRLAGQTQDSGTADALRRWSKGGKKLRKALEPLRDADVFLARLDGLRQSLKEARADEPQLSPRCMRHIDKLECLLKRQREKGIEKLMPVLGSRAKRLNRLSKEMETALTSSRLTAMGSASQAALKIFSALATELPNLDSSNLHAYRKRFKHALYLAEISAESDPLAARLAVAFKKIHLAAGEWHDWQALALEAARLLPSCDKQDGLLPVLNMIADKALRKALGLTRRDAAGFVMKSGEIRPSPGRKPVIGSPGGVSDGESRPLAM